MISFEFYDHLLPTLGINHLINNYTQLEVLTLQSCQLCDDGLIITKEADKLQHIKSLNLSYNPNLTDESFINILNTEYRYSSLRGIL